MTALSARGSREEFALFNPAFVAEVVSEATRGHREGIGTPGSVPIVFSAAVIAMYAHVREQLPPTARTHLPKFLLQEPGFRPEFHRLMRGSIVPLWLGLTFATNEGALSLQGLQVVATGARRRRPSGLSEETIAVLEASKWCGRWLGKSGPPATVLSMLGYER